MGAVSTQRGEGLNRHLKHHMSLQTPLTKLLKEVLIRRAKEKMRATVKDAVDEFRLVGTTTSQPWTPPSASGRSTPLRWTAP
mmetsp:Transcript_38287/g.108245  ORF Transcript_38287/g.108245 Transcript_38287/m.108245 type:complete len:82 (-) Transcript_38287:127-372(-)